MNKNTSQLVAPTVLVILDGFGIAPPNDPGNAITPSTAPHIFSYFDAYPSTLLKAHGKDVGLFANQEGNSEAGHLNIGTGRLVEQDILRISRTIKDGTFFKNPAFEDVCKHVKKHKSSVHLMGLLTNGESGHTCPEHLYALLKICEEHKNSNVYLHLFTDGRDSPPHQALEYLRELREHMNPNVKIATIGGRFYGMDRGKNWLRTKQAYDAMVRGSGCQARSAEEAITQAYNRGESDEFICPTVIVDEKGPITTIGDNDAIIFFNARSDRARQITKVFMQPDFSKKNKAAFRRTRVPKNIKFVAMTDFGPDLSTTITAFPSPEYEYALASVIDNSRKQLYISETEKYAHVTYFINGGHAKPINGEERTLISSPQAYSYAEKPQMSASKVTTVIINHLKKGTYNFVAVNYPNADMLGHTGDIVAAKKAITHLDKQVKRLVETVQSLGGDIMITADHGNAEEMINKETGEMMTEHTKNPVPCIIISDKLTKKRLRKNGRLADIAPTLLKLMDIKKPKEMTGASLF